MKKKQFKAESKKLLDLMVNSIYTNKDIFLRELISNASDAIDKLYYESLTNHKIKCKKEDFFIQVDVDKENRTLTIFDNGCGMDMEALENNLGTIAKSGSLAFKEENEKKEDISIIGQFGVGFYSAFMVSDHISVTSKAFSSDKAYCWSSSGAEGYEIEEVEKESVGTTITLHIKEDTKEENFSKYLEEYTIRELIKKYSDYIRYPIRMNVEHFHKNKDSEEEEKVIELETINSMVPLWKKNKKEVKKEEYDRFYQDKFMDYEVPFKVMHHSMEGVVDYQSLLFIPSHVPYNFYTKEYEKGLELYSNGVLIMEKCSDLLPDYFSFVKGLVDSSDVSLNISRELLQQDYQLRQISKSIENKIRKELENMLKEEREEYEKFFSMFGTQLKYGVYDQFGKDKDVLKDLLLFASSKEKFTSLKEYISRMKEGQEDIYFASGESTSKIALLPQVERVLEKGYEILYLTDYVDEFVMQTLMEYDGKKLKNVCVEDFNLATEEEKEDLKKRNEESKDLLECMKESLEQEVLKVRFTNRLKKHPVCLTSEGNLSIGMQKVMNAMPMDEKIAAKLVLEINEEHPIVETLHKLYKEDLEKLKKYTKILYAQARLIEGLPIENPTELSTLISDVLIEK